MYLSVTKGKGSDDSTEKPHELKGAPNGCPDEAQKYVWAGQKDHCHQEEARYPNKDLIQKPADLIQLLHIGLCGSVFLSGGGYTDFGVCYPEIRSPLVSLESGMIVPGYLYIL